MDKHPTEICFFDIGSGAISAPNRTEITSKKTNKIYKQDHNKVRVFFEKNLKIWP